MLVCPNMFWNCTNVTFTNILRTWHLQNFNIYDIVRTWHLQNFLLSIVSYIQWPNVQKWVAVIDSTDALKSSGCKTGSHRGRDHRGAGWRLTPSFRMEQTLHCQGARLLVKLAFLPSVSLNFQAFLPYCYRISTLMWSKKAPGRISAHLIARLVNVVCAVIV